MTADDLKLCKRDEKGRAMVRDICGDAASIVVGEPDVRGHVVIDYGGKAGYDIILLTDLCPIPAHPHAELIAEAREAAGESVVSINNLCALITRLCDALEGSKS